MKHTELVTNRPVAQIGEEISHELGAQMIHDFQVANPNEIHSFIIGRDIIEQILAQPGCVGIQFHNAINENGEKTLVYIGLDKSGKAIVSYKAVNEQGVLTEEKGIVADKVRPGGTWDPFEWLKTLF